MNRFSDTPWLREFQAKQERLVKELRTLSSMRLQEREIRERIEHGDDDEQNF